MQRNQEKKSHPIETIGRDENYKKDLNKLGSESTVIEIKNSLERFKQHDFFEKIEKFSKF